MQTVFTDFFDSESAIVAGEVIKGLEKASNALTTEEIVSKVLADINMKGWSVLIEPTEEALAQIYEDGTRVALAQINFDAGEAMTSYLNERSTAYAAERAADLVGMRNIGSKEVPHFVINPDAEFAITDSTRDMLRATVTDSIEKGYSTDKLKQEIMDSQGFSKGRAQMIARTETAIADVNGNMAAYRASGVVSGKEWVLGSEHDLDDECLIGSMMIRSGPVLHGISRQYSGKLITLHLSSGDEFTGTPNHPVLTDAGWKPLKNIHQGDNLISGDWMKRIGVIANYFDKVETSIQDKVASFTGRLATTPTSSRDFHGDGIGSHVHTIFAAGPLNKKISTSRNKIMQPFFGLRVMLTALLSGYRNCFVRVLNSSFARLGSALFRPQPLCFASGPQLKPMTPEPLDNGTARDTANLSNLDRGKILFKIKSGEIVSGVLGSCLSRLSVTRVTDFVDSVHVYNLHTKDGFFITQNVVTRNCDLNVEAGAIPLDELFPSGEDCPPSHPNCTCDVLPVVMEGTEEGEE